MSHGLAQMIAMRYGCVPLARYRRQKMIVDFGSAGNGTGFDTNHCNGLCRNAATSFVHFGWCGMISRGCGISPGKTQPFNTFGSTGKCWE
jgi:hypothetical protein